MKDVRVPENLQRAMAAEAEAARNARAKVIAAEGEHKASRALRHAAEIISENPAALQVTHVTPLSPAPLPPNPVHHLRREQQHHHLPRARGHHRLLGRQGEGWEIRNEELYPARMGIKGREDGTSHFLMSQLNFFMRAQLRYLIFGLLYYKT